MISQRFCRKVTTSLYLGIFMILLISAPGLAAESGNRYKALKILPIQPKPPPSDLGIETLEHKNLRLSDFKGKVVFLNFWASWCRECLEELPTIERLHQAFVGTDLVIIGVNLEDNAETVKRFYQRFELTFPSVLDTTGAVGERFFIRALPTSIILNREGLMIGIAYGSRLWDGNQAAALFHSLLAD